MLADKRWFWGGKLEITDNWREIWPWFSGFFYWPI